MYERTSVVGYAGIKKGAAVRLPWGWMGCYFLDFDFLTVAHFFEGVAALTRAIAHWWAVIPGLDPEDAYAARPFLYSCSTEPGVRPLSWAFLRSVVFVFLLSSSWMIDWMRSMRVVDSDCVSCRGVFFQPGFCLACFSMRSLLR